MRPFFLRVPLVQDLHCQSHLCRRASILLEGTSRPRPPLSEPSVVLVSAALVRTGQVLLSSRQMVTPSSARFHSLMVRWSSSLVSDSRISPPSSFQLPGQVVQAVSSAGFWSVQPAYCGEAGLGVFGSSLSEARTLMFHLNSQGLDVSTFPHLCYGRRLHGSNNGSQCKVLYLAVKSYTSQVF